MAKEKESAVASLNPDDFISAGLKDDFRGRIREAVYAPWDYNGNIDEPVLGVRLTIDVDDEEDEFVQYWSAGDLASFVPSQDGKTPTDGEGMEMEPGPYALRVGKRTALNNNTNFAHLMTSIIEAGEASKKFTRKNLTASLECLEGLYAHWNRVPQKKRAGLVEEDGEKKRANDVLVVTEVLGYGDEDNKAKAKAGAKAGSKSNKTGGKKAVEADDDEEEEEEEDEEEESDKSPLDEKLEGIITELLDEKSPLKKSKIANLVLSAAAKDKDKQKLVKRCTEDEFLNAGPWDYDEDTGVISKKDEDEDED